MVIVKLIGGLGNQLFQYAAGLSLAEYHRTSLKLDIGAFEDYTRRTYSLARFNIKAKIATPDEIRLVINGSPGIMPRLKRRVAKKLGSFKPSFFNELVVRPFNHLIFETSKDVYLDGYWQSEKYFVKVKKQIQREFTLTTDLDSESKAVAELIARSESVGVHIRRGDYISNPDANKTHGVCSIDYYYECINRLSATIDDPHFFFFSDEPEWVCKNIHSGFTQTIVAHNNADKGHEDLWLMSLCKHQIIANSSFSWWAAWLNKNLGKRVLAPRRWFIDPKIDSCDLVPSTWERL